ncbi:MAG: hypothetical protein RLZZ187_588 [Pseudomonadota bacterium]|jgi:MFS family permease
MSIMQPPAWIAPLGRTLAVQVAMAASLQTLVVLAPFYMPGLGWEPHAIGLISATAAIGTVLYLLGVQALMGLFGPLRLLRHCVLLSAAGLGLLVLDGVLWLFAAAFICGLGRAMGTPVGSHVLAGVAPEGRRATILSVHQCGPPLGGFLCGLLLPRLAEALGWQMAVLLLVAAGLTTLLALRRIEIAPDDPAARDLPRNWRAALASAAEPLRSLGSHPGLPPVALLVVLLAIAQAGFGVFGVALMIEQHGISPVVAGTAFGAMMIGGIVGRLGFGWLVDRSGTPFRNLALQTIVSGALLVAASLAPAAAATPWLIGVAFLVGAVSLGWQGVAIAIAVQLVPRLRLAEVVAGFSLLAFAVSFFAAPLAVYLAKSILGSLAIALSVAGILVAGAGMLVLAIGWKVFGRR